MKNIIFLFFLLFNYPINAQDLKVIVHAKHVIDVVTKNKYAEYLYEITNNSTKPINNLYLGVNNVSESIDLDYRMLQNYPSTAWQVPTVFSPLGWTSSVEDVAKQFTYVVHWIGSSNVPAYDIPLGKSTVQTRQNFIVRIPKADPAFVTTYLSTGFYEGSFGRVESFDKIAPKMSVSLIAHADAQRTGWLKVQAHPIITDDYDPHPEVRLSSISSTDTTFKPADIDALLDEKTMIFWVKRSPNRQYSIKFTGFDASGNKVEKTQMLWAP